MIVSPDILRRETIALIKDIDRQIEQLEEEALTMRTSSNRLRDTNGNWMLNPLLLAKAMAYNTLVELQARK